jgi:HAD superfamily hydrolase (TIGR01509 family)
MIIAIPIGGVGERFSKAGYLEPKPLIPINKKTIIEYLLDSLQSFTTSEDEIVIFHHNHLPGFSEFISKTYPSITLLNIGPPTKGAVDTVLKGLDNLKNLENLENKPILLLDCDAFYTVNILQQLRTLPKTSNAVFCFEEVLMTGQFSYIRTSETSETVPSRVVEIKEKEPISSLANTGAYFFRSVSTLHHFARKVIESQHMFRNEYYTSCVIDCMITNEEIFVPFEIKRSQVTFLGTPVQVNDFSTSRYAMLFDLDGTLVDSDALYLHVWSKLLPDVDMTKEIFKEHIQGRCDKIALSRFIFEVSEEDVSKISFEKDRIFVENLHEIVVMDGALEFIQSLWIQGHKIYIVTNSNRLSAEGVLEFTGLNKWVDGLIIGNECARSKPYADPYLEAMKRLSFPNDRCIIFEDSKTGLLSARSAFPMAVIGITSSMSTDELLNCGATFTIDNFINCELSMLVSHYNHNNTQSHSSPISLLSELEKNVLVSITNSPYSQKSKYVEAKAGRVQLKGGYIADVIPFVLMDSFGKTRSTILKYENEKESELGNMAKRLDLYNREYYFYTDVQNHVPVHTPSFFSLLYDGDQQRGVILENMYDNGHKSLSVKTSNIETTLCIIRRLAKMHSKFWNKNIKNIFPFLKPWNDPSFDFMTKFVKKRWPMFQQRWSHILNSKKMELGRRAVRDFERHKEYLSEGEHLTLLHGDVKYANILFKPLNDEYFEPCFIDWQYVGIGKGIQDVVFFLIESYDIDQLETMASIIFPYYYICLWQEGVKNYTKSQFEKDISVASRFYPFFVAIWFGTTPREDLVDINFPLFFIQKLFHFLSFRST